MVRPIPTEPLDLPPNNYPVKLFYKSLCHGNSFWKMAKESGQQVGQRCRKIKPELLPSECFFSLPGEGDKIISNWQTKLLKHFSFFTFRIEKLKVMANEATNFSNLKCSFFNYKISDKIAKILLLKWFYTKKTSL